MTPEPIPLRSLSILECRNCGAGAPVDEHFCPQCSRILALGRHGDYFTFLGLPRQLTIDPQDLEKRFRELSRKFHPDYYYNAAPAERLASLERSSYLNDAYRAIKNPVSRVEHLLAIEGMAPAKLEDPSTGTSAAKVPPSLLEEVFALNEELDEIRELRESGTAPERLCARLDAARAPIDAKREEHERQLQALSARWDSEVDAPAEQKRKTLEALRERLLERNYINNLIATIEREVASIRDSAIRAQGSGLRTSAVAKVVGIDLGTTNSLVAYVDNGAPVVIRDESGDALVPSIVSIGDDGTIFVGREAQRRLLTAPSRTVYSVKRFMGRGIEDVKGEAGLLPFRVGGDPGGVVRIGVADREFTPPEISAFVLRELKHRADEHFRARGEFDFEVDRAVITVPAYFNDAQRTATRDAGRLAGLEVLRIINEPTAASLAYGLDKRNRGTIAVYDLGGGTFDISILKVEEGIFQVLSTNGDTHLGGDDVDRLLMEQVIAEIANAGSDTAPAAARAASGPLSGEAVQEIRKAVIQAKWDLSDAQEAEISVEPSAGVPGGYRKRITRADFEQLIRPLIDRTLDPCRQALSDAGLQPKDIDEAVLVGGSTRIPLVRRLVQELFGREPHSELNPDEVVALGAAIQADILVSGRREMLLLDVTPLSLGIETMGGVVSKIILRNSTIPASGREMFTTGVDNQTGVDIHVLQGERELAADCRSLSHLHLRGIPPMPAGLPRIEVRFQIDANGILSVAARELRTGIEQAIEVKPSYGLTDGEVERMLIESFEHAEADFEARLLIDARNEAESVITATEKVLRRPDFAAIAAEQLAPGERERIEAALGELKASMANTDRVVIHDKTHALNHATQHLAEVTMNRSVREALAGRNVKDV